MQFPSGFQQGGVPAHTCPILVNSVIPLWEPRCNHAKSSVTSFVVSIINSSTIKWIKMVQNRWGGARRARNRLPDTFSSSSLLLSGIELSDTKNYKPQIRNLLGTALHKWLSNYLPDACTLGVPRIIHRILPHPPIPSCTIHLHLLCNPLHSTPSFITTLSGSRFEV